MYILIVVGIYIVLLILLIQNTKCLYLNNDIGELGICCKWDVECTSLCSVIIHYKRRKSILNGECISPYILFYYIYNASNYLLF